MGPWRCSSAGVHTGTSHSSNSFCTCRRDQVPAPKRIAASIPVLTKSTSSVDVWICTSMPVWCEVKSGSRGSSHCARKEAIDEARADRGSDRTLEICERLLNLRPQQRALRCQLDLAAEG